MSSLRRILASQRNGRLTRGPVTPQAKAASSQNSISHGLCSQTIVLSNESHERFDELLQSLTAEFQPQTPAEHLCVLQMAASAWRTQRAWAIETALLDHQLDASSHLPDQTGQVTRLALAFKELHENGRAVAALGTHQGRLLREYDKAYRRLCHLQESRAAASDRQDEES